MRREPLLARPGWGKVHLKWREPGAIRRELKASGGDSARSLSTRASDLVRVAFVAATFLLAWLLDPRKNRISFQVALLVSLAAALVAYVVESLFTFCPSEIRVTDLGIDL